MAERLRSIRSAVGLKSRARRSALELGFGRPPAVPDVALRPDSRPLGRPSGLGRGIGPARLPSTASGFMTALGCLPRRWLRSGMDAPPHLRMSVLAGPPPVVTLLNVLQRPGYRRWRAAAAQPAGANPTRWASVCYQGWK